MRLFFLFSIILLSISNSSFYCQKERIALVIGNANYKNGLLNNTINDALLIANTLTELNFHVELDTNITDRAHFFEIISNFQDERKNYDIGFIYYAGHAVQINGINYLLATDIDYQSEKDVKRDGIPVNIITDDYITIENNIDILIIDACRDNPFEANRSLKQEAINFAEITSQSKGSIIAFSTSAGTKASDGNIAEKNSPYCKSLSKNMLLEGITIKEVFENTAIDMEELGAQEPEVFDRLRGAKFYLKKKSYKNELMEIDSLIDSKEFMLALEKISGILYQDSLNTDLLFRKGIIEINRLGKSYDGKDFRKALELNNDSPEIYKLLSEYYLTVGIIDSAFYFVNNGISKITNDSLKAEYLNLRGKILVIKGNFYDALIDFNNCIQINPDKPEYYYSRGLLQLNNLNNTKKALKDFETAIDLDPFYAAAFFKIGEVLGDEKEYTKAVDFYNKVIDLGNSNPRLASYALINRSNIYIEQDSLDLAFNDINNAIKLNPLSSDLYRIRGSFYQNQLNDNNNALLNYTEAIKLDPKNYKNWFLRGNLYANSIMDSELAMDDFMVASKKDSTKSEVYIAIGNVYMTNNDFESSLYYFNKAIELNYKDTFLMIDSYLKRTIVYRKLNRIQDALQDLDYLVEKDNSNPIIYARRGYHNFYYENKLQQSIDDYSKAIEFDQQNMTYYLERSRVYNKMKDFKKETSDLEKAISLDRDNDSLKKELVYVKILDKIANGQNVSLEKCIVSDTNNVENLIFNAKICIQLSDYEIAQHYIDKAIEKSNPFTEALFLKATINDSLNNHLVALKYYYDCLYLLQKNEASFFDQSFTKINSAIIHFRIGQLYENLNEYNLMIEEFLVALYELNFDNTYYANNLKEKMESKIQEHSKK